jgi:cytochrome c peroxidase
MRITIRSVPIGTPLVLLALAACHDGGEQTGPQLVTVPPGSTAHDSAPHPLLPLSRTRFRQLAGAAWIDRAAAVRLGKALFWDIQVGGDGMTACATCHSTAGVDNRQVNTVHPGPGGVFDIVGGPGQAFSGVSFSSPNRVGSQGVVRAVFQQVDPDPTHAADICLPDPASSLFFPQRGVTGRNTPPMIGAIFFRSVFWDGRAGRVFNGINPFGGNGASGGDPLGTGRRTAVPPGQPDLPVDQGAVDFAALASQADGPPNDGVEMSCAGRTFNGPNSLATKLLARRPLALQAVSASDGVLGKLAMAPGTGLNTTYQQMIKAAFGRLGTKPELSFSRIFGLAILAYESTLIPDRTPLDRYLLGDSTALTATQKLGKDLFTSARMKCIDCHAFGELSDATWTYFDAEGPINDDGGDTGFHNIGVRPTSEDVGHGGVDPSGKPFSQSGAIQDQGAFKTPSLRNVKLSAPYFHNGGKATLEDVVDFYARGGDFQNQGKATDVEGFTIDDAEKAALVDFLRNALTDCRVEGEQAPFDHPSLPLPNARYGDLPAVGAAGRVKICR